MKGGGKARSVLMSGRWHEGHLSRSDHSFSTGMGDGTCSEEGLGFMLPTFT